MIRRAALVLLLVAASTSPACLLVESAPVDSHDGRVASCDAVTEDGVTEHLDAFAERCGNEAP